MPFMSGPSWIFTAVMTRPMNEPPNNFGLESDLVRRADHSDRIGRIGRDIDDVGVGRLHRAHDRREIGRLGRIGAVEDRR